MLLMETAHLQRNKSRQIKALVIGYFTKAFIGIIIFFAQINHPL